MNVRFILPTLFLSFFINVASAQYFEDGTTNLPDGGTRFSSMDVRAADLDGDGDLDVVLGNEFQANTILINDGAGSFSFSFGNLPQVDHDSEDIAIADFDQDGENELLFFYSIFNHDAYVLYSNNFQDETKFEWSYH